MPRKTRRALPSATGPARPSPVTRGLAGHALTALVAAALGSGLTYAALRPALQAARAAPSPPALGAGGASGAANGAALAAQGNAAFDKKDWPAAIAAYTQALAAGLDNPDLRTDLGTAYRGARQPQKALEQYQAAQREDPRHENSLLNQGIVYAFDLNDPSQALTVWQQYLTRFPQGKHVADVKKLIATTLSQTRPPAAPKS